MACVGVAFGWMWAEGEERHRLLRVFAEQCARAAMLGCTTVMSPVDKGKGSVRQAAASVREVGDLAAAARVRLAVEFNSQADQLNFTRAYPRGADHGRASGVWTAARYLPSAA